MKVAAIINLFSSFLLALAMYRQVIILLELKKGDPFIATKILFPCFNVFLLAGMWLPSFDHTLAAAIFFLMAALIAVWTYYFSPK